MEKLGRRFDRWLGYTPLQDATPRMEKVIVRMFRIMLYPTYVLFNFLEVLINKQGYFGKFQLKLMSWTGTLTGVLLRIFKK